jgi:hypothetical protein
MPANPSRALFVALAAFAVLAASSGSAAARTVISNPFGVSVAVDVIIGSKTNPSGAVEQVVVWQQVGTDTCQTTVIGNASGLDDDYLVQLSNDRDLLWIPASDWGVGSCLGHGTTLSRAGHYIDVDMLAGNDDGNAIGDTYLYGGTGNDRLRTFDPVGGVFGDDGDDTLSAESSSGTEERLDGGNDNDCLDDFSQSSAFFDCGPGEDQFVGSPTDGENNCEMPVNFCP